MNVGELIREVSQNIRRAIICTHWGMIQTTRGREWGQRRRKLYLCMKCSPLAPQDALFVFSCRIQPPTHATRPSWNDLIIAPGISAALRNFSAWVSYQQLVPSALMCVLDHCARAPSFLMVVFTFYDPLTTCLPNKASAFVELHRFHGLLTFLRSVESY